MKIKAAVLVAIAGLSAGPALAQSRWVDGPGYYVEGLPTRVIMRTVRMQGLMPVSRPMRRENVYVVEAIDEFDRPRRVVIDARSARVVAVQPSGRPAPGPYAGRDYAMRPPRAVPGGEFEDNFNAPPPNGAPPRLPPLRRPYGEQGAAVPPPPSEGEGSLGPVPPPPAPRTATPSQKSPQAAPPRTASVNPTHPPAPRPRPAAPAAPETSAVPSKPKGLPRVVLPGGPLPKSQRTAETQPGRPEHDNRNAKAAPAAAETPAAPAAQPAPAPTPAPAPGASEIPPAQTLE